MRPLTSTSAETCQISISCLLQHALLNLWVRFLKRQGQSTLSVCCSQKKFTTQQLSNLLKYFTKTSTLARQSVKHSTMQKIVLNSQRIRNRQKSSRYFSRRIEIKMTYYGLRKLKPMNATKLRQNEVSCTVCQTISS